MGNTNTGFARSKMGNAMTEDKHFYFAYGSNMNPERVEKRGLNIGSITAGVLEGYYLSFNKRSVVHLGAASANIIQQTTLG